MVLRLDDVWRSYASTRGPVHVLRGASLEARAGEVVVITGESGAGKTTLLNLAGLLDAPTRGAVAFEGRPVERRAADALRLRRVGFVFQHHYLAPDLTARENALLPALAAGALDAEARVDALLERVGLARDVADRLPRELSGGEQQRAGVARALVNRPALVVADEPTASLDESSGAAVARLLAQAADEGAAVLVATHDPARFPGAHRRLALRGGVVVEA